MATHSSFLARKIQWTEEPGGLQFMGSASGMTEQLSTHTHIHTHTQLVGGRFITLTRGLHSALYQLFCLISGSTTPADANWHVPKC